VELLVYGDINSDYIIESIARGRGLASLLTTFNLLHTVNFATGIQSNPNTVIHNTFVDKFLYYISHNK
jgi:hypothetical protein